MMLMSQRLSRLRYWLLTYFVGMPEYQHPGLLLRLQRWFLKLEHATWKRRKRHGH